MALSEAVHGSWLQLFSPAQAARQATTAEPFGQVLDDAEVLLTFAAETGMTVPNDVIEAILEARCAFRSGHDDQRVPAAFYEAYGKLAKQLGDVSASTIRSCSSTQTRWTLQVNRFCAALITVLIACVSVATFVADSMSAGISDDTTTANASATALRASLTPPGSSTAIDPIYAKRDPCTLLAEPPKRESAKVPHSAADIEALQRFAIVIRDLHGRALKLNRLVHWLGLVECDPLGACSDPRHTYPDASQARAQTQIQPAILNFDAEVLCKIQTFQTIRGFAANVQADYVAVMGGIAAFALPIAYAWLGAYAFRLRAFAEAIRKRTYHPTFADSARMITAVIAGAIAGLFHPAQGLSLSPLAIAFLVGYGVELFFKFLDTLIGAFGRTT